MVKLTFNVVLSILICFFFISFLTKIYKIVCSTNVSSNKLLVVCFVDYLNDGVSYGVELENLPIKMVEWSDVII